MMTSSTARNTRVAIVGSCVSRDPFSVVPTNAIEVTSYVARQSFIGIGTPPLAYDTEWYSDLHDFERRCVITDLSKNDLFWLCEKNADFLLIDYIDERFDILEIENTFISKTKHVMQPGFMARYENDIVSQSRLKQDTTNLWQKGAELFFARALQTFPADRIILHEAAWAPYLKSQDGVLSEFHPVFARMIEPSNRLLSEYYDITKALVPGISIIKVSDANLYADPDHRWSKEPFHYITDYYKEFLEKLTIVVEEKL